MKFVKSKEEILGHIQVKFKCEDSRPIGGMPLIIGASRQGIWFSGDSPILESEEDLEEFARTTSLAWAEHRSLIPQIITSH